MTLALVETARHGSTFAGALALDRMLAGVVDLPTVVASPAGDDEEWIELDAWMASQSSSVQSRSRSLSE